MAVPTEQQQRRPRGGSRSRAPGAPWALLGACALLLARASPLRAEDGRFVVVGRDASDRVALVIGNNAYAKSPLENAVNDANSMAKVLGATGFTVTSVTDVDMAGMARSIEDFVGRLKPNDVGLFFYAGHGMQIDGENYLIPVDFAAQDEVEAKYQSYAADRIRERMESSGSRLNIIILDACRNNPFKRTRAGGGGLAAMSGGRGTLIALATGPGAVASDQSIGNNGLFTSHLADAILEPGLELSDVFRRAREKVDEASAHRQVPWVLSSVIGEFHFQAPTGGKPSLESPEALEFAQIEGALPVLERAAAEGSAKSAMLLGKAHGAAGRPAAAVRAYLRAADLERAAANQAGVRSALGALGGLRETLAPDEMLALSTTLGEQGEAADAFRWAESAAQAGDVAGMERTATLLLQGAGTERSVASAQSWLNRAALAHEREARLVAALRCRSLALAEQGSGPEARLASEGLTPLLRRLAGERALSGAALPWLRAAAAAGHVDAMRTLGSELAATDRNEAYSWIEKAGRTLEKDARWQDALQSYLELAELGGESRARERLDPLVETLDKDPQIVASGACQAFGAALERAAELALPAAFQLVGRCYQDADPARSRRAYRRAAEAGLPDAMYRVALMYSNGRGGERDLAETERWLVKASERDLMEAKIALADLRLNAGVGAPSDGVRLLEEAVAAGQAIAMDMLATHHHGHERYGEARDLYLRAAERGYAEAYANLGVMYWNGDGGAADRERAVDAWRLGVERGDARCMYHLAVAQSLGLGISKDTRAARGLYQKAARGGHPEAREWCRANGVAFD